MAIREGIDFSGMTLYGVDGQDDKEVPSATIYGIDDLPTEKPKSSIFEDIGDWFDDTFTDKTPVLSDEEIASIKGPTMKAVELPWYEEMWENLKDVSKDTHKQAAHSDSLSGIQNMWRTLFTLQQAQPEYDKDGNLLKVRKETIEEMRKRIELERESAKKVYGLSDDGFAYYAGKALTIAADPLTYTPFGNSYKTVAALGGAVTAIDVAAYQAAERGEINPEEVAIYSLLGAALGPAIKVIGDKAIPFYKARRAAKLSHEEALKETQSAFAEEVKQYWVAGGEHRISKPEPVPMLPAPRESMGPHYIGPEGEAVGTPYRHAPYKGTTIKEQPVDKVGKAQQEDALWAAHLDSKTSLADEVEQALLNKESTPITIAFKKSLERESRATEQVINHMNQGGGISQNLMYHMATTSAGAAIGGLVTGDERGAVLGALGGLSAPLTLKHLVAKPLGKLSQWSRHDHAGPFARAKFFSSPESTLKSFGKYGQAMAKAIERMNLNTDMAVGDQLIRMTKTLKGFDREDVLAVRGVLNHTIKPEAASAKISKAAHDVKKQFDEVLEHAVDTGVLTRKKAVALKAKAAKDGYFPRVYDVAYLSSKEGKAAWVKAWTEHEGSAKDLVKTLEAITGDADVVAKFMKNVKGNKLTRTQAMDLLSMMRNRSSNQRSSHLEHERAIPAKLENLLEPFMIKDPSAAMARYFHDSFKRIEASRVFGGTGHNSKGVPVRDHDHVANQLIEHLHAQHGKEAADLAKETYMASVGDSSSRMLQKYLDLTEMEGRILRTAGGFETAAKLGLAQTANVFQATVNGMTRQLALGTNPVSALRRQVWQTMRTLGSKEAREFGDRIGAALETTLMEIAGEATSMGKVGENVLKYSGFIAAEKLQRRIAANVGKAYVEDILEKLGRVKVGSAAEKRLHRQLDELGVPTNRAATQTDIERASLKFSNDINFRNTPDKLPQFMQSPYGKLAFKFKSFAFHQAKFVKNNVIKPLLRGNPMPLVWYASAGATIGMSVDEVRRLVKGDTRELELTERYLRGITMVGGLGLMQDIISSVGRGDGQGALALAGPAAGDVLRIGAGAYQSAADQDPSKLLEAITRTFVFPGQRWVIDELKEEGKKRGRRGRNKSRGSSRGSGR